MLLVHLWTVMLWFSSISVSCLEDLPHLTEYLKMCVFMSIYSAPWQGKKSKTTAKQDLYVNTSSFTQGKGILKPSPQKLLCLQENPIYYLLIFCRVPGVPIKLLAIKSLSWESASGGSHVRKYIPRVCCEKTAPLEVCSCHSWVLSGSSNLCQTVVERL